MTEELIAPDRGQDAVAIRLVGKDGFDAFARTLSAGQRAALTAQKFTGGPYRARWRRLVRDRGG
jgi:leucyl aminopeptidase